MPQQPDEKRFLVAMDVHSGRVLHTLWLTDVAVYVVPAGSPDEARGKAEASRMSGSDGMTFSSSDDPSEVARLQRILDAVMLTLQVECSDVDAMDWPPDLHPSDVISKHLVRAYQEKLKALEGEPSNEWIERRQAVLDRYNEALTVIADGARLQEVLPPDHPARQTDPAVQLAEAWRWALWALWPGRYKEPDQGGPKPANWTDSKTEPALAQRVAPLSEADLADLRAHMDRHGPTNPAPGSGIGHGWPWGVPENDLLVRRLLATIDLLGGRVLDR